MDEILMAPLLLWSPDIFPLCRGTRQVHQLSARNRNRPIDLPEQGEVVVKILGGEKPEGFWTGEVF